MPLQVHYYSEAIPTTALRVFVGVNTPKRYRQLQVKGLPKVPTWRLESDSNLKALNLPLSHVVSQCVVDVVTSIPCHVFHVVMCRLLWAGDSSLLKLHSYCNCFLSEFFLLSHAAATWLFPPKNCSQYISLFKKIGNLWTDIST